MQTHSTNLQQPAQVVYLSDWREARAAANEDTKPKLTIDVHLPVDALPRDRFEGITISDTSLEDISIRTGDLAVVFLTDDVEGGDIALYETTSGEKRIGKYHPAMYGWMRLEPLSDEYETEIYSPSEGKPIGRVTHFERDGQIIKRIMGCRRLATLYQFKPKKGGAQQ